MDMLYKMPPNISRAAKFFRKYQNKLLRDFYEIIQISKRDRFFLRTLRDFETELESFDIPWIPKEEYAIFLDGTENLKQGIPLFCMVYLEKLDILVHDIVSNTVYWGNQYEFFINQVKCKNWKDVKSPTSITDSVIPDSLRISWFFGGIIETFKCNNDVFNNTLQNIPVNDEIFHK